MSELLKYANPTVSFKYDYDTSDYRLQINTSSLPTAVLTHKDGNRAIYINLIELDFPEKLKRIKVSIGEIFEFSDSFINKLELRVKDGNGFQPTRVDYGGSRKDYNLTDVTAIDNLPLSFAYLEKNGVVRFEYTTAENSTFYSNHYNNSFGAYFNALAVIFQSEYKHKSIPYFSLGKENSGKGFAPEPSWTYGLGKTFLSWLIHNEIFMPA